MITSKTFLTTLTSLVGQYCNEDEHLQAFLKTGHTDHTFYRLGKHFSLRQQLNRFAKIKDNCGLRFLRTTTLYGVVAFIESTFLMCLKTFQTMIEISQSLCFIREKTQLRNGPCHLSQKQSSQQSDQPYLTSRHQQFASIENFDIIHNSLEPCLKLWFGLTVHSYFLHFSQLSRTYCDQQESYYTIPCNRDGSNGYMSYGCSTF